MTREELRALWEHCNTSGNRWSDEVILAFAKEAHTAGFHSGVEAAAMLSERVRAAVLDDAIAHVLDTLVAYYKSPQYEARMWENEIDPMLQDALEALARLRPR